MKKFAASLPYIGLIQSIVAMLGSLFFSNVLNLPPCVLCWYQRICMYPLVALFVVGILKKDKHLPYYVLPLSSIGLLISMYHNLLYYHILPESIAPCSNGVSCTTQQILLLGFITIPLLSCTAFAIITASMLLYLRVEHKKTATSLRGSEATKQSPQVLQKPMGSPRFSRRSR